MGAFHPLSEHTRRRLLAADLDPDAVAAVVRMAVAEDLVGGVDITSVATVPAGQRSVGTFASRGHGVLAGLAVAAATIDAVCGDAASDLDYLAADGDRVAPGQGVARVEAPTRDLLTAERTALNLLCHLSGVATLTRRWADALDGTSCVVRDTRKTTPGLRALEKYAVRCGGGANHRMGLSDAALVKDNHVLAAGGVAEAFAAVRSLQGGIPVEIEVDSLDSLRIAIDAGADTVLLDNFDLDEMRAAVRFRDATGRAVLLEASGGLTLEVARQVGETGVDHVAVGELTHSAKVLDIGLDLESVVHTELSFDSGPIRPQSKDRSW
jgi:nicotinate-nucleotide pyrophosphorylase (carboxylating)